MRWLVGRAPFREPFRPKGRRWLAGLDLPAEERESVDAALRQIDFLDPEIEAVERLICSEARESEEIRRLMTVPGVNVICGTVETVQSESQAIITSKRPSSHSPMIQLAFMTLPRRVCRSHPAPVPFRFAGDLVLG
jgi:hypothetical protein